jgi:hypothetical protein
MICEGVMEGGVDGRMRMGERGRIGGFGFAGFLRGQCSGTFCVGGTFSRGTRGKVDDMNLIVGSEVTPGDLIAEQIPPIPLHKALGKLGQRAADISHSNRVRRLRLVHTQRK